MARIREMKLTVHIEDTLPNSDQDLEWTVEWPGTGANPIFLIEGLNRGIKLLQEKISSMIVATYGPQKNTGETK